LSRRTSSFLFTRKNAPTQGTPFSGKDLHLAVNRGDLQAVAEILAQKPQFINFTLDGQTALHAAAKKGHDQIFEQLLARSAELLDVTDKNGNMRCTWRFGGDVPTS